MYLVDRLRWQLPLEFDVFGEALAWTSQPETSTSPSNQDVDALWLELSCGMRKMWLCFGISWSSVAEHRGAGVA